MKISLKRIFPLGLMLCVPLIIQAAPANILIVAGTDPASQTAGSNLATELTTAGNTVTQVNSGVPADILTPAYTQIYDTRYSDSPAFSVGEQAQYVAFLNAAPGNALFLMGEDDGFLTRNTAIGSFIALAGGGTVAAPATQSSASETVNSPFTGPNAIANVTFSACGIATTAGTGAFASSEAGGGCAIFFSIGTLANATTGALAVVYDANFVTTAPSPSGVNEDSFRLNLEAFLAAPTTAPTVTSITPSNGSTSGGTPVIIIGTGFTGATAVTIGGSAAVNVNVVDDFTITAYTPAGTAGSASVVVTTPNGLSSPNTLYTYGSDPSFQMYTLFPINLQIIQNGSLIVSGSTTLVANQSQQWRATTSTAWLTLTADQGNFPGAFAVTASAIGLATGTYNGTVTITAANQTLDVPVTLAVLAPQSLTSDTAGISIASGYPAANAAGYDIQIDGPGLLFSAQTAAKSNSWLSLSPTSGVSPATIHVVLDPTKATPGIYQDTIIVSSPGAPNTLAIPVTMSVSGFIPTLPQLVNAATGAGPDRTVSPNEIAALSLSDFACDSTPIVSINGVPVSWSSWTTDQIKFAVPASVTQGSVLSVSCNGTMAWSFNGLNVASELPGILTLDGAGIGQAAATNADGSTNAATNTASSGSSISVYVTGFGVFGDAGPDGQRPVAGTVTAQIGDAPATVSYAGDVTGNTDALQQVNLTVPAGVAAGPAIPLQIWVNGVPAQSTATVAIQ